MAKFGTKSGSGWPDKIENQSKANGGSCFNDKADSCTGNQQSILPENEKALKASLVGRPSFDASEQAVHGGAGHGTDCYPGCGG
jgi:hypothetical protein